MSLKLFIRYVATLSKGIITVSNRRLTFLRHIVLTLQLLTSPAEAEMPRVTCTTLCIDFLGRCDISNLNGGLGLSRNQGVHYRQNNEFYFRTGILSCSDATFSKIRTGIISPSYLARAYIFDYLGMT